MSKKSSVFHEKINRGDTAELTDRQTMMTIEKGRQIFQENIGVTPSVAAPGDTNPSDATESNEVKIILRCGFLSIVN